MLLIREPAHSAPREALRQIGPMLHIQERREAQEIPAQQEQQEMREALLLQEQPVQEVQLLQEYLKIQEVPHLPEQALHIHQEVQADTHLLLRMLQEQAELQEHQLLQEQALIMLQADRQDLLLRMLQELREVMLRQGHLLRGPLHQDRHLQEHLTQAQPEGPVHMDRPVHPDTGLQAAQLRHAEQATLLHGPLPVHRQRVPAKSTDFFLHLKALSVLPLFMRQCLC